MTDRRKNSVTCKQCRSTKTHRRSGICVVCESGVTVEPCRRGVRLCGQIVLSHDQAITLSNMIIDHIEGS